MKNITLLFFLFPVLLLAQPSAVDWDQKFGDANGEVFHDIIQSSNGNVVAVGESSKKGGNGIFAIANGKTGERIYQHTHGGKKEDKLLAVVQTFDGYFIMAGYTKSMTNGKKDAWILKTKETGEVIWEKNYGGNKNDIFNSLVVLDDGNVLAAGYLDGEDSGRSWLFCIDAKTGGKVWDKAPEQGFKPLRKMIKMKNREGTLAFMGQDGDNVRIGIADKRGFFRLAKTIDQKKYQEGQSLVQLDDSGLAVFGFTWGKTKGKCDMWLYAFDQFGNKRWERTYGGRDLDYGYSATKAMDGSLLLAGQTKSHSSTAREFNLMVVNVEIDGQERWSRNNYGGGKSETLTSMVELHDGGYIFGGATEQDAAGSKDAWLIKLGGAYTETNPNPDLSYSPIKFEDGNNGQLDANESGYLSFEITNNSREPIYRISAKVAPMIKTTGLEFWDKIYIGTLKGEEKKIVRIPVRSTNQLQAGNSAFKVAVSTFNKQDKELVANMSSHVKRPATLYVSDSKFITAKAQAERGIPVSFTMNIQNTGDVTSEDIGVEFKYPVGIRPLKDSQFNLRKIRPKTTNSVNFEFIISDDFKGEAVELNCIVTDGGVQKIEKTFTATVEKKEMASSSIVINTPARNNGTGGVATKTDQVKIFWTDPDPSEVNIKKITVKDGYIDIKLKTLANKSLKPGDFKVYINGVSMSGSKFDEEDLRPAKKERDYYTQTYKNRLPLNKGLNKIQIQVKNSEMLDISDEMFVDYSPELPNLHILAIGISHDDLRFTTKDAEDFAKAFEGQEGKIFNKVFIKKMTNKSLTSDVGIKKAFVDLMRSYRGIEEGSITDRDLVVVFMSSHGKNDKQMRRFKILPSNYDAEYESAGIGIVDFQEDIVRKLNQMQCKKLMFIDACHSGGAYASAKDKVDKTRSSALNTLLTSAPGLTTMTSCNRSELSYEDEKWQNGAFTESILEAFANKSVTDSKGGFKADQDGNKIITIKELYSYLKRRVPGLVRKFKPDAPTTQIPFMPDSELNSDIPIFVVK